MSLHKINNYIFWLFLILFLLLNIQTSLSQAWDSCPFGLENDPYPGECGRYIDTDQDGICDLSQPNPADISKSPGDNTVVSNVNKNQEDNSINVFTLPEEEDYSVEISGSQLKNMTITEIAQLWNIDDNQLLLKLIENLLLEGQYNTQNTINDLRAEMRFSPSLVKMVAEELKIQSNTSKKEQQLSQGDSQINNQETQEEYISPKVIFPDYNLPEIGLITLILYFGSKLVTSYLKVSSAKEKKFWNLFLLISFLGSAGTGFILIFIRDFDWFRSINFNFLFWHVEFSIAMGLIGLFHALWHTKYYLEIFRK